MSDSDEHAAKEPVHGGHHAVDAAIECGAQALFTLSGAHIFPLFDAAVGGADAVRSADSTQSAERGGRLPLLDVRHEQTAVFAAEAVGKLSRIPGFAAVTAGPGVTNALSAVTGAWMNGSPLVLVGGRAPDYRWGSGALQELDHVPLVAPVTKSATTVHDASEIGATIDAAFGTARTPHRGPTFVDIPMDVFFTPTTSSTPPDTGASGGADQEIVGDLDRAASILAGACRPLLVIGSDVWAGAAVEAAREFVASAQIPTIANGMGRGILHPSDPLLVTRARSVAFTDADVVIVAGAPVDFRLGLRHVRLQGFIPTHTGHPSHRLANADRLARTARTADRRRSQSDIRRPAGPGSCCGHGLRPVVPSRIDERRGRERLHHVVSTPG